MKNRVQTYLFILIGIVLILTNSCEKDEKSSKKDPVITWANPADISYGTLLSATQLNATADVPGEFVYSPAIGTKLNEGANQDLKVDFTPNDAANYNKASKKVKINVNGKKDPVITWANPADITYGTLLSATQLNATADVAGTFVYTPASGALLSVGDNQNLKVDFTPDDATNYNIATKTVTINVTDPFTIGASYQGGKIAYIFKVGDPGYVAGQTHGLIAAVADQGGIITWWNGTYTTTGATATAIGTGSANTTAIIASQGNTGTYAAKICRDYTGGGYNDWYLPSKDELNKLYLNKAAIGGFGINPYWSSTENSNEDAWGQNFSNGNQQLIWKDFPYLTRAVRTF
jgi:hypothetical protein